MKITKKEAIKECRDMWQWLSRNPTMEKFDYFYLIKNIDPNSDEAPANLCYTCEYSNRGTALPVREISIDCSTCLLLSLWAPELTVKDVTILQQGNNFISPCVYPNSVYIKWIVSKNSLFAQQIADYCNNLLGEDND